MTKRKPKSEWKRFAWPDDEAAFVCSFAHGHSYKEITDAVNSKYKNGRSLKQVKELLKTRGVRTGTHDPKTLSQKRWKDKTIGSESWDGGNGSGYLQVKTEHGWKRKHVLVWEETHGMSVPDDCQLMFADHDRANCSPENIVAVPKRLLPAIIRNKYPYHNAETLKTAMLMAEIQTAKANSRERAGLPRYAHKKGN